MIKLQEIKRKILNLKERKNLKTEKGLKIFLLKKREQIDNYFNKKPSNNSTSDSNKKNFKFKSNKFKNFRNDNLNEREESSGNRKKFKFKKKFKNRKRPKNFSFKKFKKN